MKEVEIPRACSLASLKIRLSDAVGGYELVEPNDLQLATTSCQRMVLLIQNCHRLQRDALAWLLGALLDRVGRGDHTRVSFVVEGAHDIDATLLDIFPQGLSEDPMVIYPDASTPWSSMVMTEEVFSTRPREYAIELVPWVLDHARDDLGLTLEFLERLPRDGTITNDTVGAAWRYVEERSAASVDIRNAGRVIRASLLSRFVSGEVVSDLAPPNFSSSSIRDLYFSGVVAYDRITRGYRVRSPATARILSSLELDGTEGVRPETVMASSVHARTSYMIWQIGTLELHLRSLLQSVDCVALARLVKSETKWVGVHKPLRAAAAQAGANVEALRAVDRALKDVMPEQTTVLDAARERLKVAKDDEITSSDVLKASTFFDVVALARRAGVLGDKFNAMMDDVNRGRNDVAHFRGMSYDQGVMVTDALRCVLRALTKVE